MSAERRTETTADTLEADLNAWVEARIEEGHETGVFLIPDMWDDLNTSSRIAEFLASLGWRKSP
jgi:hypothetical protein